MYPVLMPINRMAPPSVNIATLLKLVSLYLLMPPFLLNIGTKLSSLPHTLLIVFLAKSLAILLLWNVFIIKNQITTLSKLLGVHAIPIFVHTIVINSSFILLNVRFLAIVIFTKAISALKLLLDVSIFQGMLFLTKLCFLLPNLIPT